MPRSDEEFRELFRSAWEGPEVWLFAQHPGQIPEGMKRALGFTQQDVDRLRDMDRHDADVQFCAELAGRIERLVPSS